MRSVVALLLATAAVLAVPGCGIGDDTAPRGLAVSTTTTEPVSSPTTGGASAVVYYVLNEDLAPVTRSLPDRATGTVLNALFEPPGDEGTSRGLTTSIPTGTELRSVATSGETLTVDLSSDFENLTGPARQQALGQIVLTATESPDITTLRFTIDGRPIRVTSPTRGDTDSVTACDFAPLLLNPLEALASDLDDSEQERLRMRVADLEAGCPRTTTTLP